LKVQAAIWIAFFRDIFTDDQFSSQEEESALRNAESSDNARLVHILAVRAIGKREMSLSSSMEVYLDWLGLSAEVKLLEGSFEGCEVEEVLRDPVVV
jgi:hypothetical protein